MLTPSTRATIRPRSLSTSAISHTQTRTLFGWKRRLATYESHLDPLYPRYIRHRAFKTRAKLLKTIRRRQQFEWGTEAKPLLGLKHVRYASHSDGSGRPPWNKGGHNAEGYELSDREKAWNKKMDALRKRIENDPYEAEFGKRFEPFWTPLVPQWVKDEMGLSKKDSEKTTEPVSGNP